MCYRCGACNRSVDRGAPPVAHPRRVRLTRRRLHCPLRDRGQTVLAKEGILGGHSLVHTAKTTKPLLDVPMQPGDSLLINDRDIYHSVSNITLAPGHTFGHRDVILITARPWPTNSAGELIDDVANAQLSLLEGVIEDPEPHHEVRFAMRSWGERLGKIGRFLVGA